MTKYRMPDNTILDTDRATKHWTEDTRWNGNNHISLATGSQWEHETLYRSRKGRFYVEHTSQWQGSTPHVNWVDNQTAVSWLLANGHEVPEELAALAEEITE